jgi:RecA/RadA recombinase
MAGKKKKIIRKKPVKKEEVEETPPPPPPPEHSSSFPRPVFDPRELAANISEAINKGKQGKNKRKLPVRTGADADNADIIRYVSMGTSALDAAVGGGIPCGRMSMVYGAPSAGKSLILESAILSAQMRGGIGCIIDSEHTFNKARFSAKGGHVPSVLFLEPRSLEEGFEYIEKTIKNLIAHPTFFGKPIVVGWDTINTNQTSNKVSGNQYASGMMEAPRVIWDGFRKVTALIASSNIAFVVLNQVYGDKIPPGGKGLQFYSTQIDYLEEGDRYYSYRTGRYGKILKAEVRKNKANPPLNDVVYFCCDSVGVDDTMSLYFNMITRGKGAKIVDPGFFKKAGSWTNYTMDSGEVVAWQGEKGFYLKSVEIPELADELAKKIWKIWPPASPASVEADSEFVEFFGRDNKWVEEGKRYSQCLISDHQCPVNIWTQCRSRYWTECALDLPDVVTLQRVYHDPPELEGDAVVQPEPEDVEEHEDDD